MTKKIRGSKVKKEIRMDKHTVKMIYKDHDFKQIFKLMAQKNQKKVKTPQKASEEGRAGVIPVRILDIDFERDSFGGLENTSNASNSSNTHFQFKLEYYFLVDRHNKENSLRQRWCRKLELMHDEHLTALLKAYQTSILMKIEQVEKGDFEESEGTPEHQIELLNSKMDSVLEFVTQKRIDLRLESEIINVEEVVLKTKFLYKIQKGELVPDDLDLSIGDQAAQMLKNEPSPKKNIFEVDDSIRWKKKRDKIVEEIEDDMKHEYNNDLMKKKFDEIESYVSIYLYEKILGIKKRFFKQDGLNKTEVFHELDEFASNFIVDFAKRLVALKPEMTPKTPKKLLDKRPLGQNLTPSRRSLSRGGRSGRSTPKNGKNGFGRNSHSKAFGGVGVLGDADFGARKRLSGRSSAKKRSSVKNLVNSGNTDRTRDSVQKKLKI